ncbi:helix-turn-helix transcriptional regulator [Ruminococcus sp. JL13D9]|uniref:helix-turn-helix transcriptional regulator n=1 Tax=Ruminococcus sp. JL13D9 TaxID=3233381 RepID=UPI00389B177A
MQKQKLLYLQKIMLEKTDENHGLTINEIKDELESYGIKAERKSLYDDIEILQSFGLDICTVRTNTVKYYIGNRDFQIPELKLLVDAIQSSKFITRKKSLELIEKLGHLVSENDGSQLRREVYVTNRVKTVNEHIYYNVDKIHNAISENKKISFQYFKWELDTTNGNKIVKTARKNGEAYRVSPWALCWDDENYYLIAYDSEAEIIKHYRVDKMERIRLLKDERDGSELYNDFNPARYAKSVFSMFGGEECEVKLLVDNNFIGVIVDRFGSDLFIVKHDEHSFTVSVNVMLSPQFYAWVFGLGGGVRILAPERAILEFKDKILQLNL